MNRASGISVSFISILVLIALTAPVSCEENAASETDTSLNYRWGAVYTGLIDLREENRTFPWNDQAYMTRCSDRISLMFHARPGDHFDFFIKGTTGLQGLESEIYKSRLFIDQGHFSAAWRDRAAGKIFLRERVFRNRNRLMDLVSNDSEFIGRRGEGFDLAALTAGPVFLTYSGAVFRNSYAQKQNGGLPPADLEGDYLNLFEGGIQRSSWHFGLTAADIRSIPLGNSVLYGLDGGFDLAGGVINIEFSRTASCWDCFEDGFFGIDFDSMKWGSFSAGLPADGALAAEWTGFSWKTEKRGRFGLTPGYRSSGERFNDVIGEVSSGYVESYIETWWKHAKLASLVTVKFADRFDYSTGKGGGVLETSLWTRLRGGLETTARAFFAKGYRPALIISSIDDNKLTRLLMTARLDDTGGESEFSFLTEAGINLGRRWTLGGSVYLERSLSGFYSADIEMRGGKRYVFRASAGTYIPFSTYSDLNYDPAPPQTVKDKTVSLYMRIWLGGI